MRNKIVYMLDTCTVSDLLKGNTKVQSNFLAAQRNGVVCISTITEAELRYGLAKNSMMKADTKEQILWFLQSTDIMPWDSPAAKEYATMRVKSTVTGQTLGNMDLLIISHAESLAATLVSSDKAVLRMVTSGIDWRL